MVPLKDKWHCHNAGKLLSVWNYWFKVYYQLKNKFTENWKKEKLKNVNQCAR